MKTTDWFPMDVKPVHEGVYQLQGWHTGTLHHYSKWDGKKWCLTTDTAREALRWNSASCGVKRKQYTAWRGVVQENPLDGLLANCVTQFNNMFTAGAGKTCSVKMDKPHEESWRRWAQHEVLPIECYVTTAMENEE